ncbi:MAG TPA: hypothetical protein ACFYD3_02170 [Candidatus Hypogeohydataceae bacterium YC41]
MIFALFLSSLCVQYIYTKYIFPDHITPALRVMRFLLEQENPKPGTRVFTDTDHILAWRANLVVFQPVAPSIAADFLTAREQNDFYGLMRKYNIQYIINDPWKSPWEESIFNSIENDNQHFKEIYRDVSGVKVWKVVYD